jgi:hypothetical protein
MLRRTCCITLVLVLAGFTLSAGENIHTTKENGAFITEGWIDSGSWTDEAWDELRDFSNYEAWAFTGLDGKDPVSARYIGLLTHLKYTAPDIMVIVYDVNLPWPFGSKDNEARFTVRHFEADGREHILFEMEKPSIATESVTLEMTMDSGNMSERVEYRASIRFTWLIDSFFSLPRYRRNIEQRIFRVLDNFQNWQAHD